MAFGFFKNKKESKPTQRPLRLSAEEIELQKRVKEQDRMISIFSVARSKYKETGNAEEFFESCRKFFSKDSVYKKHSNFAFFYVEALIKEKRYDEAWGTLNKIYLNSHDNTGRVHSLQYQILKNEKKHTKDAIYHLMASHLLKTKWIEDPADYYVNCEKVKFLKNLKPLAKKVGFSENQMEYLSFLIESAASSGNYSDSDLYDRYYAFLKEQDLTRDV